MGLFADIHKKFGPLKVQDQFFGQLIYMKMPKGRASYWEAKCVFPPHGREVELFIDAPAPKTPPNELQRQFFSSVANRYSEVLASAEALLRPRFEELTRQPLQKSFGDEFVLSSFSIPVSSLETASWEMSFESCSDPNHLFSVSFLGMLAKQVAIDG